MTSQYDMQITFDGLSINSVLGNRYQLLERIGKGGMAEVFRAVDLKLKREVAVKLMRSKYANDESLTRQFETEAQAAAQLRSPHAVAVFDVGIDQGNRYIVMELVHGKNLKSILEATDHLPPRNVARIALQTCLALIEAHAVGIVHRDIKPANIMITHGDRKGAVNVQITDFGIAKAERFVGPDNNQGRIMGTPRYMSPEQFTGHSGTAQSDLYSLGVVMYEAVTGCVPFPQVDTDELSYAHQNTKPIDPQLLCEYLDDELGAIIMKALEKNPQNRFANSAEFAEQLEVYLSANEHQLTHRAFPKSWVIEFITAPDSIRGSLRSITEPTVIGRGTAADIIVPESSVSRTHLKMTPRGMYLELENLSKVNRTRIDGELINYNKIVEAGTVCTLGNVKIRIGRTI